MRNFIEFTKRDTKQSVFINPSRVKYFEPHSEGVKLKMGLRDTVFISEPIEKFVEALNDQ